MDRRTELEIPRSKGEISDEDYETAMSELIEEG